MNAFTKEEVKAMLELNMNDFLSAGIKYRDEGETQAAINQFLKIWQTNRNNYAWSKTMFDWYASVDEIDLAGRFLLHAVKTGMPYSVFQTQVINSPLFDKIKEMPDFITYLNEIETHYETLNRQRGELSFIEISKIIRYRTVFPENYDPDKQYTIVMFLHGNAGSLHSSLDWMGKLLANEEFIIIIPEAPYPLENLWTDVRVTYQPFGWAMQDGGWEISRQSFRMTIDYLSKLVVELRSKYNPADVYLIGHSQGASLTLATGISHTDLFDGLISICGGLGWYDAILSRGRETIEACISRDKTIPILKIWGLNHTTTHYETAYERLKTAGWDVTLLNHEGGHHFSADVVEKIVEWILEQENKKYD